MPDIHDPLTTTLDALRSDVERTPLADSMAVRRRGEQRTRRQAVGGALAVVALVAGAVGLAGGVGGDDRATQLPATQSPTPTAAPEKPLALASDPFLRDSDVAEIGPYQLMRSPDSTDALGQKQLLCMPLAQDLGAPQTEGQYFYSDLEAAFKENVLRFGSAAEATAAADRLAATFARCPQGDPAEISSVDRQAEQVALGAQGAQVATRMSRLSTPVQAGEYFYYELGIARRQNVVVVLEWTSNGNPMGDGSTAWVWDAERLSAALDRAAG